MSVARFIGEEEHEDIYNCKGGQGHEGDGNEAEPGEEFGGTRNSGDAGGETFGDDVIVE